MRWSASDGVFRVDGRPRMLLMGDYPYYRDERENWEPRLRWMRDAGLDVLTCYVPWRHHAPHDLLRGGEADFDGRTQPNRDLLGLLDLAASLDLHVLLKPGPFVHAELPYGGLPDHVCPECGDAEVEPERDAFGEPVRWAPTLMPPESRHPLPAPFGSAYLRHVRAWMGAFAREVLRRHAAPRGGVFALQLMNEGIYSDSARADPRMLGFAPSTLARFRDMLRERHGTLEEYGRRHGTRHASWDEIGPPREVRTLRAPRDLLAYLEWSEFQGRLYAECAREYRRMLVDAGCPPDMPVVFNFNPNSLTFRDLPASNDGWYTRVNPPDAGDLVFGLTNWVGVVCSEPAAFRQYVMATTSFRGPSMEQNWGFSSQYFQPYERVTPSVFESMLAIAAGATGLCAYTFAGTRAWRRDPNVRVDWLPARTNERGDATSGDYPGDAPILSDGTRTGKLWTLHQAAQYLRATAPRFLAAGPDAPVAWAIYAPYAWSGQWLPRGDPDDLLWRPPLQAVPRGAYHGLDAFVEMMLERGVGFRQVDVREDSLSGCSLLCLSAHEFMDAAAQERLARHVEEGGSLLLTNLVPDKDERLEPFAGALARRVLPHRVTRRLTLARPTAVEVDGEPLGKALEFAFVVEPPDDAEALVTLGGECVGYERRVGRGRALYLGIGPWRAALSGDDPVVARENQRLTWRLVERLTGGRIAPARPRAGGDALAWLHPCEGAGAAQAFVVVRDRAGLVEVEVDGARGPRTLRLRSPSQAVQSVLLEDGGIGAAWLKGVNDLRGEAVAPEVEVDGDRFAAGDPCDACLTREGDGWLLTVAHLGTGSTWVRLPRAAKASRATRADGAQARLREGAHGLEVEATDVARGGACRLE